MSKLKNFSLDNVEIQPVKFITKDFWNLTQTLFSCSYKTSNKNNGTRIVPYNKHTNRTHRISIATLNGQMIGFIKIINFDEVIESILEYDPAANIYDSSHPLWDKNRPQNVNRRQIETCWVNPRFQSKGIATKLYKFAIEHMGATHIHIDENRVIDNLEYWKELGFTKCSLYKMLGAELPSLRLHLDYDCEDLWNLDYPELCRMFFDRDMKPSFGRSRFSNIIKI
jgi:ribosomal protein S18 acetylase RimI-like enzyme